MNNNVQNAQNVQFDDFRIATKKEQKEGISNWTYLCNHCRKKLGFQKKLDDNVPAEVICGIQGCQNEADFYLDLPTEISKENIHKNILTININSIN